MKKLEEKYLATQKAANRYQKKGKKDIVKVARYLIMYKYKLEAEYIDTKTIKYYCKYISN